MKIVLALIGAAVFGSLVWLTVAADVADLWNGAGLYALVVLAFPAFIAFGVWRGWGR